MAVNSRRLSMYIKTVEAGGINKAARELMVVPQSLSEQIARLEDEVGATLLERLPTGVVPTKAGQEFYEGAKRLLAYEDGLITRCRALDTSTSRLTIGQYPLSLDAVSVAEVVAKQRPDLSVELIPSTGKGDSMLMNLIHGTVDAVEWIGHKTAEERGLAFAKVCDVEVVGVMAPSNPLMNKAALSHADLASSRVTARSALWFEDLVGQMEAEGLKLSIEDEDFGYQQVVSFCANDGGIFLAKSSCMPMMMGLACLPLEEPLTCEFGVAYRDIKDPGVTDYLDAVREFHQR